MKRKQKKRLRSICVYCGSGVGQNPLFAEAARKFGKTLAKNGITLVYGGGSLGIMGELSRAVIENGGNVVGIIPKFLIEKERPCLDGTDGKKVTVVRNMHKRKMLMYELADAFVALPGGLGTLEELVEQLTWAQMGHHKKPILIANIGRFWDLLFDLIDHMKDETFIRDGLTIEPLVADRVEDILPILRGELVSMSANGNGKHVQVM